MKFQLNSSSTEQKWKAAKKRRFLISTRVSGNGWIRWWQLNTNLKEKFQKEKICCFIAMKVYLNTPNSGFVALKFEDERLSRKKIEISGELLNSKPSRNLQKKDENSKNLFTSCRLLKSKVSLDNYTHFHFLNRSWWFVL